MRAKGGERPLPGVHVPSSLPQTHCHVVATSLKMQAGSSSMAEEEYQESLARLTERMDTILESMRRTTERATSTSSSSSSSMSDEQRQEAERKFKVEMRSQLESKGVALHTISALLDDDSDTRQQNAKRGRDGPANLTSPASQRPAHGDRFDDGHMHQD